MNPEIVDKIQASYKEKTDKQVSLKERIGTADKDDNLKKILIESAKAQIKHRQIHEPNVSIKNMPDIASPDDVDKLAEAVDGLTVAMHTAQEEATETLVDAVADLAEEIGNLPSEISMTPVVESLSKVEAAVKAIPVAQDTSPAIVRAVESLEKQVKALKLDPKIDVKAPEVSVVTDLEPLLASVKDLKTAITSVEVAEFPETDLTPLVKATDKTTKAINSLVFPVPNYILPFRDVSGKAIQVQLDASGNIPTSGSIGGTTNYATKIDNTTTANAIYIGNAALGSSGASAVWQIKRLDTATIALDKTWADGNASFDNTWNNRASLTYL